MWWDTIQIHVVEMAIHMEAHQVHVSFPLLQKNIHANHKTIWNNILLIFAAFPAKVFFFIRALWRRRNVAPGSRQADEIQEQLQDGQWWQGPRMSYLSATCPTLTDSYQHSPLCRVAIVNLYLWLSLTVSFVNFVQSNATCCASPRPGFGRQAVGARKPSKAGISWGAACGSGDDLPKRLSAGKWGMICKTLLLYPICSECSQQSCDCLNLKPSPKFTCQRKKIQTETARIWGWLK